MTDSLGNIYQSPYFSLQDVARGYRMYHEKKREGQKVLESKTLFCPFK